MYTLYYAPGAASLCVHWMLIELGVKHDARRVDLQKKEHKTPEYLKLNPNGLVPALVIDGHALFESSGLLLLLAERHPEAGLAPPPGSKHRATYLTWMVHLANTLQPSFRYWFYPAEAAGEANAEAAKEQACQRIEACWDRISAQLEAAGPYLAGDRVSALDFFATMLMRWSRNMPKPATDWPVLKNYVARMKLRPTFRALYQREELTDWN